MKTTITAALAVLAAVFLPRPGGAAQGEEIERICGWVHDQESLTAQDLESLMETPGRLDEDCRQVLRCLMTARRSPSAASEAAAGAEALATAEALCGAVLALSTEDLEALVDRRASVESDAAAPEGEPCTKFLQCALQLKETGSWREDFERICARTEDAAWLPREEIEKLIRESRALLEKIEMLQIPEAKIYAFRLEKCKAFFEYALELQERDPAEDG